MAERRVAVTGMGIISALGLNLEENWAKEGMRLRATARGYMCPAPLNISLSFAPSPEAASVIRK